MCVLRYVKFTEDRGHKSVEMGLALFNRKHSDLSEDQRYLPFSKLRHAHAKEKQKPSMCVEMICAHAQSGYRSVSV